MSHYVYFISSNIRTTKFRLNPTCWAELKICKTNTVFVDRVSSKYIYRVKCDSPWEHLQKCVILFTVNLDPPGIFKYGSRKKAACSPFKKRLEYSK